MARFALVVAGADRWGADQLVDLARARAAVDQSAALVRRYGAHVVFVRHGGPDELVLRPVSTDSVVVAAGIDGFFGSNLDALLRDWGCTHLAIAGFGLEGPVHSTLRSANDRGYECLLLADACAAVGEQTRRGALSMVTTSGGIFGAVGTTAHLAALLEAAPAAGATSAGRILGAVEAQPCRWPAYGIIDPERTAVLNIDWQRDFCGPGGYLDAMGYDLSLTSAGLGPTAAVLAAVRSLGFHVVHTREGHRPDLSDCPANKLWRSRRIGAGIGDRGPAGRILVRGEPGWEIVPEVAPLVGEPVIDKPGKGAFYGTDLDLLLRTAGVTHLVLTGITTDVCVQTTMREAKDRGYDCLLLSDCTGATDVGNYQAALNMVVMQGGTHLDQRGFGSVATSTAFLAALG